MPHLTSDDLVLSFESKFLGPGGWHWRSEPTYKALWFGAQTGVLELIVGGLLSLFAPAAFLIFYAAGAARLICLVWPDRERRQLYGMLALLLAIVGVWLALPVLALIAFPLTFWLAMNAHRRHVTLHRRNLQQHKAARRADRAAPRGRNPLITHPAVRAATPVTDRSPLA